MNLVRILLAFATTIAGLCGYAGAEHPFSVAARALFFIVLITFVASVGVRVIARSTDSERRRRRKTEVAVMPSAGAVASE